MASSVIGSLDIRLAVITAPLVKGLKQARGELATFAKAATSPFAALAAAAGVGLGVAAMKSYIGAAQESIDDTAKLADRLGIATEAYVGLAHAADLAGVDNELFAKSLDKMQKSIGEAAQGATAPAAALERLGLDAQQLANGGAGEAFVQIAEGIKAIENPAERAAVVTDIFGKSGQALIATLTLGREGLAAAAAEADQLGISFSRVDAAQVEAANDALTNVGKVFEGIANQVAIQLAPFIEELSKRFTGAAAQGQTMGDLVGKAFEYIAQGAAYFADVLGTVPLIFKQAQIAVTSGLQGMTQKLLDFSQAVTELTGIGSALNPEEGFLFAFNEELKNSAAGLQTELDTALAAPSNGEKITKFFEDIRASSRAAAEDIAIANQQFGNFDDTFERLKEQEDKAKKAKPRELGTTGAAVRGSSEAFSTINRSLTKPGEDTAKNTKAIAGEAKKHTDLLRKIDAALATTNTASIV